MTSFFKPEKNADMKIPLYLIYGWAVTVLLSIFFTPVSILLKGSVIISILFRIGILVCVYFLFKSLFGDKELDKKLYENQLMLIGYLIVFTYVFSMLPQVVSDYYQLDLWGGSAVYIVLIVLTTAWPSVLWLMLNSDKNRINSGAYSLKDVEYKNSLKKDKKKKKAEYSKRHKERSFVQNVWAEWLEPLFGAVLWVLVINHFILQLYQIPSESMVPTFLIKDRVLVGKTLYGPKIPLTDRSFPRIVKPDTGDVIVFSNPKNEDPDSEYYYNSVFTRVFHTFFYMISLTTVDIDAKPNGDPKERLLVKRNIAGEEEKLCLVNDKVYKKRKGEDWVLMEEIPGEKEYGNVELFAKNNRRQHLQMETEETRAIIEDTEQLIEQSNLDDLNESLKKEKELYISKVSKLDYQELTDFQMDISALIPELSDKYNNIYNSSIAAIKINTSGFAPGSKQAYLDSFKKQLEDYPYLLLSGEVRAFINLSIKGLQNDDYLHKLILTDLKPGENSSPYDKFMSKLNTLYKLRRLQFFNQIIENGFEYNRNAIDNEISRDLYDILFFVNGIGAIRTFGGSHFPEYPEGDGNYIAKNEYFVMGDNRYNSLDSRMGDSPKLVAVDPLDKSDFSLRAEVMWDPHTIPLRLVLGKVRFILFPLDRFKMFSF